MTFVSRRKISDNVSKRIFEVFLKTFRALKKDDEIISFLDEFLTPTEKMVLEKRLAIAVMLTKGFDYRTIEDVLKVTSNTIARVAYWIKHKKKGFSKIIEDVVAKETNEEFWNGLGEVVVKALSLRQDIYRAARGGIPYEPKSEEKPF